MRDVIVIGSGISGLGAALQLGRWGHSVTLIEACSEVGGLIRPVREAGYSFDVGLQYVGQAGPGETFPRFLDQLGVDLQFRPLDPACMERYVMPGFESRLVRGREAQEALLVGQFPGEAEGIRWFFDTVHALDAIVGGAVGELRRPLRPWIVLRRAPDLLAAMRLDTVSFLRGRIRDPYLIAALSCFIGDIGLPPSRASAISTLIDWAHFLRGAWYPIGGSGAVVDAFVRAMAPLDVEIRTEATVERVRPGAPLVVTLHGGEQLVARSVVLCVDACVALRWIEGDLPAGLRRRVEGFAPSLSAYGAFLGVEGDLRDLGLNDGNLWHYEADDLDSLFQPLLAGHDPDRLALYFCSPSLKDPGTPRAPTGRQALTVLAWAPATQGAGAPPLGEAGVERARVERVLEAAERALPGLRGRVVFQRDFTPQTVWRHARGRQGGFYAAAMNPEQSLPRRFSPWTGISGVYLAGASIFGCGVLPSLLSGRIAAWFARRHIG